MLQLEPGALIAGSVTVLGLLGGAFAWFAKFVQGQLDKQREHDAAMVERFDKIIERINGHLTALHVAVNDVRQNACRHSK